MGGVVWIALITIFAVCRASPLPHRLKYDQRQEGKWNVRADLENFIILVIPTSSSSSPASNGSLLDFLTRTIPLPHYKKSKKHQKVHQQQEDESLPDTEQFIESKTAPYHVDISRTRNHLAKLHPEVNIPESVKEEIIIARSPSVALTKSLENGEEGEDSLRNARAILISVPMENENIQRHSLKDVVGGKGNGDELKKTLGMSIDAIEKGLSLAAETQKKPLKVDKVVEIIVTEKPEDSKDNYYTDGLKKVAEDFKTAHAIVVAKTVHLGLVEYFRKLAEKLKEKREAEREKEEEEEALWKASNGGGLRGKIRKTVLEVKEKRQEKEKGGFKEDKVKAKDENGLKMNLEPPKMPEEESSKQPAEASKENSNEQLLLLGAELEQCGPGRERDSTGVCTSSVKA